jgi:hypothetical protein
MTSITQISEWIKYENYLNVPFSEKDKARRLGAHWDLARKKWYVENMEDLTPFLRWMADHHKHPYGWRNPQDKA